MDNAISLKDKLHIILLKIMAHIKQHVVIHTIIFYHTRNVAEQKQFHYRPIVL